MDQVQFQSTQIGDSVKYQGSEYVVQEKLYGDPPEFSLAGVSHRANAYSCEVIEKVSEGGEAPGYLPGHTGVLSPSKPGPVPDLGPSKTPRR